MTDGFVVCWSLVEFGKLTAAETGALVVEVLTLATTGQLVLPVDRVLPLSQCAAAMARC